MPGFWFRLRRLVGAEAHGAVARLEDPVRLAEAGVRDLRANLTEAVTSLARIKGVAIRLRREQGERAGDFRRKAVALVQRGRSGELDGTEANRLAAEALRLQGDAEVRGALLEKRAGEQERLAARLQTRIEELRRMISGYEDDLLTLQARATQGRAPVFTLSDSDAALPLLNALQLCLSGKNFVSFRRLNE